MVLASITIPSKQSILIFASCFMFIIILIALFGYNTKESYSERVNDEELREAERLVSSVYDPLKTDPLFEDNIDEDEDDDDED